MGRLPMVTGLGNRIFGEDLIADRKIECPFCSSPIEPQGTEFPCLVCLQTVGETDRGDFIKAAPDSRKPWEKAYLKYPSRRSNMKKIIITLAILALVGAVGCAPNSFLCVNGSKITIGLQLVISQADATIAAIEASYPGLLPDSAKAIVAAAQTAKDVAAAALAKACPTVTDLTNAQGIMTSTQKQTAVAVKYGTVTLGAPQYQE
jgi:hypothetical protein